ncbi:hypothetical protein SprV_0501882000 [Sparganum proliferum]
MDLFASGCAHFGLTINTDKKVIAHQQPSTAENSAPSIGVNGTELKNVNNFDYLGSTMSRCIRIDDEKAHRILNTSQVFGHQNNSCKVMLPPVPADREAQNDAARTY